MKAWQGALASVMMVLLVGCAGVVGSPAPALSIEELRQSRAASRWTTVGPLPGGPGFTASLIAYRSSGLRVHAAVATPAGSPPPQGFPVLIVNHGFHPNPPRYGFTAVGEDLRPGDYYRSVPDLFTRAGFIVVMPDYRGHNNSEGLTFTTSASAAAYYSEDVIALLPGLVDLKMADLRHVFMWGHSMGGEVTLRALLATARIKGASLWSSTAPAGWDPVPHLPALRTPLMIQHAMGDPVTDHRSSVRLASALASFGLPHELHILTGHDHFFEGAQLQRAVDRDVRFFRRLMRPTPSSL